MSGNKALYTKYVVTINGLTKLTEFCTQHYFHRVRTKIQKSGGNMKSAYANTTMPCAANGYTCTYIGLVHKIARFDKR